MPLKFRSALLGGLAALAFPTLASVVIPDGDHQVYIEDFSDAAGVDADAGPAPGLDETAVIAGALRPRPGGSAAATVSFDDPGRFSFDPAAIQVAGGARLGGSGTAQPVAYWRMEDAAWSGAAGEVADSSGGGFSGTAFGDAAIDPAGALGQAASFGGGGYLSFGQPAALDPSPLGDDFSFSTWFKTTADGALMGKAVTSSISRQAYLFLLDGRLAANVGGVQRSGSIADLRDGEWHHAALVVSNSSSPRKYTLYVDGVADGVFTPGDNVNGADFLLGARRLNGNSGFGFTYSGALDEVAVFDVALSAADVQAIYGGGGPSVLGGYATDGPTIRDTAGIDLSGATALTGFSAVNPRAALPHGFRLSPDGSTWYFFDGAAWAVTAGGVNGGQTSDAAAVDDHIGAFTALLTPGAERLFIEVVLHSDGADAASIDGVRVEYDATPPTSAVEILGPISVGQALELQATILDEDAQHFVTVQVLGPDAATPVDDAELPGNGGGFTSAQLAAGVALDAVNAAELYLRLRFTGAGGGLSAAVDELRLRFDAPSAADLAVTVTPPSGPIQEGEPTGFQFTVENLGPGAAEDVELLITMPTPVQAGDLPPVTPPSPWGCLTLDDAPPQPGREDVSFLCLVASLPAGSVDTITVPVKLQAPFSGFSPIVAVAEVESSNDVDPSNDRAAGGVSVDAPPRALFSVEKVAEPADGTDFDFLFNGTDPFVLDARFSDDFDDVESFEEFWVAPGTYTVEELTPAASGWQLESIFCEGLPEYPTVVDVPIDAATWDFDPAQIAVIDGAASLIADPLRVGLVGYWRFEESTWQGAAPVLDTGGSLHHGALEAPAPTPGAGHVGDPAGGGADFAGGSISFGQPAALDFSPSSDAFSAGVWFKTSGDGALMGKAVGTLAQRQYYLFVFQGRLWVNVGGVQNGSPQQVADGQWHHALVVNAPDGGGGMGHTLYLDGQAAGTWTSGSGTNGADLLLGARRTSANTGTAFTLDGSLDEAAVWNRALSAAEVADLYAGSFGREITADFPTDRPSMTVKAPVESGVVDWHGLSALTGAASSGHPLYQVASAEGQWRYWDGGAWSPAASSADVNDAPTLSLHLWSFDVAPPAELWVRIFFASDGTEPVTLEGLRLAITVDEPVDATVVEGAASVNLRVGERVLCEFTNALATVEERLTVRMEAPPSSGDDVFFAFPGYGNFTLDDARPDDGDAYGPSIDLSDLPAGQYGITPFAPAGWRFDGAECTVDSEGFPVPFTLDYAGANGHHFDPALIDVDGGARLVDRLGAGLVGYWTFTGEDDFTDSSGSGFDGAAIGSVTTFDDIDDVSFSGAGAINLGQPPALDFQPSSDAFTLSLWFRPLGDGALIAKAVGPVNQRQFYLFTLQGRLWANVGGVQNSSTTGGLYDGGWRHAALVNFDDGGAMRHSLYLDGVLEGTWTSGGATNGADVLLGARRTNGNTGTSFSYSGDLDDVRIFDRDLSAAEIADLFARGHDFEPVDRFDSSGPSVIAPPVGGGGLNGQAKAVSFTAFESPGTTGEVRYQLSNDGIDWRFWNGAAWADAAGDSQRNDAATVDRHIRDFVSPSGWIWVRAFLLSDGSRPAGLDRVEIEGRDGLALPTSTGPGGRTFFFRWERGLAATCTFRFGENNEGALSFVGISVDTEPADGTDVVFTDWNGSTLTFDDARPDDGDAYPDHLLINDFGGPDEKILRITDDGGLRPLSLECGGREHYRSPTEVRFRIDGQEQIDCTARLEARPNLDIERLPYAPPALAVRDDDSAVAWFEGTGDVGEVGTLEVLEGGVRRQLVSAVDFYPQFMTFSADGRYLAFQSAGDLTGGNPDLGVEVFRIDLTDDSVFQVTDTPSDFCDYFWVSVNDAGDVAFTTTCPTFNGELFNPDGSAVVAIWSDGVTRATSLGSCSSSSSTLARGSDQPLVLFTSACDPVGLNPDENQDQLFLWAYEDEAVPYRQITRPATYDPLFFFAPAFSNDGATIAYVTTQDPSTASQDQLPRLVTYDVETGVHRVVDTFADDDVTVNFPKLSPDGTQLFALTVSQIFPPTGVPTQLLSWDLTRADPPRRLRIETEGGIDQISLTADPVTGERRLYFTSTADYEGLNPANTWSFWALRLQP